MEGRCIARMPSGDVAQWASGTCQSTFSENLARARWPCGFHPPEVGHSDAGVRRAPPAVMTRRTDPANGEGHAIGRSFRRTRRIDTGFVGYRT